MNKIDKILVKITGALLTIISILLTVLLIIFESDYDLMVLASYVFIITMIVITLMLGISFLTAKVKKTIQVIEDEREIQNEQDNKKTK